MKTYFDCIPCFVRQALDSARTATDDEQVHERLLREVLRASGEMDLRQSPPAMGRDIHRLIRKLSGLSDPYKDIKVACNRLALQLYPELKERILGSDDPFETAVRLAIAGNIMDFGVNARLSTSAVHDAIASSLGQLLDANAMKEFAQTVAEATTILYLADNAGEIVFDRLLIEQMPSEKVTVAVRGAPIINDATMEDAVATGLTQLVEVIDNGSDAPGTILDDCDERFRNRFDEADMVIAKGQGNYETLSDVEKDIFFVLKAKCPVIARDLGCEVGSLVLQRSSWDEAIARKGGNYARA